MPYLGGAYGGYIGMTGNWAYWLGCRGSFIAFSATNNAQAHVNYVTYHRGVGSGAYWFMGGPASIHTGTAPPVRPTSGGKLRRPGRYGTSRTARWTTRSCGRTSSCP